MTVSDVIDACTKIGLLSVVVLVILFFFYKWVPPAAEWFGNNLITVIMIPIRDAIIGNITLMTRMVTKLDDAIPVLHTAGVKTMEMLDERKDLDTEQRKEAEKTRAAWRTVLTVMNQKCPVESGCPFKQHKMTDSDDLSRQQQHKKKEENADRDE